MDPLHAWPSDWNPVWLPLRVATVATLIALVAGMALGWLFSRVRFPGRNLLEAVCMLPLVLPPTVLGYYILIAAGRNSPLGRLLRDRFDFTIIFTFTSQSSIKLGCDPAQKKPFTTREEGKRRTIPTDDFMPRARCSWTTDAMCFKDVSVSPDSP